MGGSRLTIHGKTAIVLAGLKGKEPTTSLPRRHGISEGGSARVKSLCARKGAQERE